MTQSERIRLRTVRFALAAATLFVAAALASCTAEQWQTFGQGMAESMPGVISDTAGEAGHRAAGLIDDDEDGSEDGYDSAGPSEGAPPERVDGSDGDFEDQPEAEDGEARSRSAAQKPAKTPGFEKAKRSKTPDSDTSDEAMKRRTYRPAKTPAAGSKSATSPTQLKPKTSKEAASVSKTAKTKPTPTAAPQRKVVHPASSKKSYGAP